MGSRTATPGAAAAIADTNTRQRSDELREPAEALAVLESLRRDSLLEAVAVAAKELLRSSDLAVSLPKVAEQIGSAAGVDRTHIFLVDFADERGEIRQHYLWAAPGVPTPAEFRNPSRPLADAGLKAWIARLAQGDTIVGHTRDLDPTARALFEKGSVKSVLSVPIFGDGQWMGMIGFDECRNERNWSAAEIGAIETLAELVGTAIVRTRDLQDLHDANHIVESSPTMLYRLEPKPPFALSFISQNAKRFGYDPDNLLALRTRWRQLINSEDLPSIEANLKAIVEGRTNSIRAEFRLRKPDGSWTWFEDDGRAIRNAEGRLTAIEGILTDITERKSTAKRRDGILKAVAASADELLRSSDLQRSLPRVIEWIGQATGVDRAHIFEVEASNPACNVLQHYMWSAPGIPSSPILAAVKGASMAKFGFAPWLPKLARGETIVGHVRDFEEPVRELFSRLGTQSVLSVPVCIDGCWWGHLGFDDCRTDREWSPTEIDTLKTLAELVGAAVVRTSHVRKLADANRIVENSPTILYRLSPQPPFNLIYLSQNVRRYGYDADKMLADPANWLEHIGSESHAKIAADIKALAEGKTQHTLIEFRLKKADGSYAWMEGRGYAVRDEQHRLTAIEGILTDITERKLAEEKIAALARTDLLTGLPNRAAFLERLNLEFLHARRGNSRFAVHYLDLDHFKDVNDTLGHPIGDDLLRAVADRLKAAVRESDMVARFGGDEFAVLQDNADDPAGVEMLAAKISRILAVPYTIDGNVVSATVSIGIVPYRADVAGPDDMMMKADLALYRAKNEGRNKFSLHVAELDAQTRERIITGDLLRHAIERRELELFYQPQVEIKSGRIIGLEALLRWNHPHRGLLLPSTFIPIAETSGSIVVIGEWVIQQACRQIRIWRDAGIAPPVVAINLSAAQFKLSADLDRVMAKNLARFGVPASQLELELTETVLMETTQKHSAAFERLRRIGVRIAIDDFGTGYSSLDYLRSFRVSRLKIDRRFISDVCTNPDDATIVRATVNLAHDLGIDVVAEGVETAEQRNFLLAIDCDLAQGHYFGTPMPEEATSTMLRQDSQLPVLLSAAR
jgi:diguanylate cyclase (GGDEF)-like protein/PAS domain S-box-containing protein